MVIIINFIDEFVSWLIIWKVPLLSLYSTCYLLPFYKNSDGSNMFCHDEFM